MALSPAALDPHEASLSGHPSSQGHDDISKITENKVPKKWYIAIGITQFDRGPAGHARLPGLTGMGVWGNNQPVAWAWDITNFVFWIGIGHAGTLISAILFLFRQKWRTSINRAAEAMTLFAVACAGIYPLFHTGRPWRALTGCCRCRTRRHVAELSQPTGVGRVRGFHLPDGLGDVLVRRTDSGSRDPA